MIRPILRQLQADGFSVPTVENPSLVFNIALIDNGQSKNPATGQKHSYINTQNVGPSCVLFIREATYLQGLSTGDADIILDSWETFCLQRCTDPLLTPVTLVMDFLLELFNSCLDIVL